MRKIVILTALIISLTTVSAQIADPFDYTEVFDYVFRSGQIRAVCAHS